MRCIVTSLTDENADLYNELKVQQSEIENVEGRSDEDNEEGVAAATVLWQPRLRNTEAHFGATGRAKRGRTDNGFAERRFGGSGSSSGGGGEATDGSIRKGDSPRDGQFDILGMLISIYGSKEPFVKEYRCLLANKLIKNLTYDTAKDLAILERLKLRFGEASMQHCDIMLKDVDESKRLNVTVQSKLSDAIEARSSLFAGGTAVFQSSKERTALVDVTVVSEHFWPPLQANDGLVLHPLAVEMMSAYNATYSVLKKPRQLQWRDQLGLVDLELEFSQPLRRRREDTCSSDGGAADRKVLKFSVSPVHATLILYFHDHDEEEDDDGSESRNRRARDWGKEPKLPVSYTASVLASMTELPVASVRRKMEFWVNVGVVSASPVNKVASSSSKKHSSGDGESGVPSFPSSLSSFNREDSSPADSEEIIYTAQDTPLDPYPGPRGGSTVTGRGDSSSEHDIDDDETSRSAMAACTNDATLRIFQNFIMGMLKNFDSMPLDRIHNMLKM